MLEAGIVVLSQTYQPGVHPVDKSVTRNKREVNQNLHYILLICYKITVL